MAEVPDVQTPMVLQIEYADPQQVRAIRNNCNTQMAYQQKDVADVADVAGQEPASARDSAQLELARCPAETELDL